MVFAVGVGAAVLGGGCDSSGTVVGADAASTDAGLPDVTFTYDGPVFDVSPPDVGSSPDAGSAADAPDFAFIELSEVPVGGGTFTAAFYTAPRQPPPGCTAEVVDGGGCAVTTCPGHAPTDAGVVTLASAGALDVTGGAFGDAGIQVGADNLGSYLYNTTGPMFSPGDVLGVSAAGGTVPPFPVQSLTAPAAITLTAPQAGDAGLLVVPTAQSLAVTWTGGVTGDRVVFTLNAFLASGASASTACSWDAAAGQGTIPASALAPLVAGTAQPGGSTALWYQLAQTTFDAGRWAVTMQADIHGGSLVAFQ
ncbi:MAG TPA: hypothetical protein VHS09_12735 [Polyangiaceae bacterium]|nr:hypothetical protein [Polyangiaceae bacterium]